MQALGRQILIELYQCDPEVLNSEERIRDILVEATRRSGATIVSHTFHTFSPHGVSGGGHCGIPRCHPHVARIRLRRR